MQLRQYRLSSRIRHLMILDSQRSGLCKIATLNLHCGQRVPTISRKGTKIIITVGIACPVGAHLIQTITQVIILIIETHIQTSLSIQIRIQHSGKRSIREIWLCTSRSMKTNSIDTLIQISGIIKLAMVKNIFSIRATRKDAPHWVPQA